MVKRFGEEPKPKPQSTIKVTSMFDPRKTTEDKGLGTKVWSANEEAMTFEEAFHELLGPSSTVEANLKQQGALVALYGVAIEYPTESNMRLLHEGIAEAGFTPQQERLVLTFIATVLAYMKNGK